MRRWIWVGVLFVLLAGCSLPAGIDGDVTDDWALPGEPTVWSPKPGECHGNAHERSASYVRLLSGHRPIACTESHVAETVHVGAFTGEHAARVTVPPEGSAAHRAAFAECVTRTTEFLGADFRTGRVWLQVRLPGSAPWSGGARWFTCELWEYQDRNEGEFEMFRAGTLRDSLKGTSPLSLGCYTVTEKNDKIDKMAPVACDKPHNAEFAGIGIARDVPLPTTDQQRRDVLGSQCFAPVAAFAGLRNDGQLSSRVGFIWQGMGANEWNRGNRGVRCWLRLEKNVTKSMKGAGPSAFPAR